MGRSLPMTAMHDAKAQIWVVKELLKYKLYLVLSTIGSTVDIVLFSLPPLIVAEVIRILFGDQDFQLILVWLLFFLVLAVVQSSNFFIGSYFNEVLAHRVTTDITAELFQRLQNRSLSYLDQYDVGQIMARATNDTRQLNIGLSPAYRFVVMAGVQLLVVGAMLVHFEPRILIVVGALLPAYLFFLYKYIRKIYPLQDQLLKDFEKISVTANETFTGIQELKSYVGERRFFNRFRDTSQAHAQTLYRRGKVEGFFYPLLVFWFGVAVTAVVGVGWVLDGSLTISDFAGALGAFLMFRFLADGLSWAATESVAAVAASNRLYRMMFDEEEVAGEIGTTPFDREHTTIEFDHVWFRYTSDSTWSLRDVSFTVKPQQTVVLVGPPGSGKSTVNKLLQRLYLPTKGQVRVGDLEVARYDNSYLQNVVTIEQTPFLFSDTVADNLRFGKPDATDDELQEVLAMAQAQKFVSELPQQLETQIGDRGIKLSGGQKQRLAIARGLLLNPSILIMDDASSALDAETEMMIQQSVEEVLESRTSVVTSHRLAMIAKADLVLVFDQGELVGQGTHEQLIRTSPHYRRLFEYHYKLPPLEKHVGVAEGGS